MAGVMERPQATCFWQRTTPPALQSLAKIGFILKKLQDSKNPQANALLISHLADHWSEFTKHFRAEDCPFDLKLMLGCIEGHGKPDQHSVFLVGTLLAFALLDTSGSSLSYIAQTAAVGDAGRIIPVRLRLAELAGAGFLVVDRCDMIRLRGDLLPLLLRLPNWLSLDFVQDKRRSRFPFFDEE